MRIFIIIGLLFACGKPNQNRRIVPPDGPNPPDPVRPVPVGQIGSFLNASFGDTGRSPVVATGPDGTKHHAAIVGSSGWPAIGVGEDELVSFPWFGGRWAPFSSELGLASDSYGTLHAVWNADDYILYAELDPRTYAGEVQVVAEVGHSPNIAVGPDDQVVVTWVVDVAEGEPPRSMLARISDGKVDATEHVNPDCCVGEVGDPATVISGSSIAFSEDGTVHLVYEWQAFGNTVIDYINDRGDTWSAPVQISNVAFAPCPALAVDSNDAVHVTYLEEGNRDVWHRTISDGELSEPTSLYTADGFIALAMMVMDVSDVMHIAVELGTAEKMQLLYVRTDQEDVMQIAEEVREGVLSPTPRAGGALITPTGDLYFAYRRNTHRRDIDGVSEVAAGVPRP